MLNYKEKIAELNAETKRLLTEARRIAKLYKLEYKTDASEAGRVARELGHENEENENTLLNLSNEMGLTLIQGSEEEKLGSSKNKSDKKFLSGNKIVYVSLKHPEKRSSSAHETTIFAFAKSVNMPEDVFKQFEQLFYDAEETRSLKITDEIVDFENITLKWMNENSEKILKLCIQRHENQNHDTDYISYVATDPEINRHKVFKISKLIETSIKVGCKFTVGKQKTSIRYVSPNMETIMHFARHGHSGGLQIHFHIGNKKKPWDEEDWVKDSLIFDTDWIKVDY